MSTRGTVDGATYTDVKAQLPAIYLLLLISLFAVRAVHRQHLAARAGCCPCSPSGCGRSWPSWPAASTRRSCSGSGSSRPSRRRSGRTSSATSRPPGPRWASTRSTTTPTSSPTSDLDDRRPARPTPTRSSNIRLLGPDDRAATPTSSSRASSRFYRFNDVDVDRYEIDGEPTQVVLAARELNTDGRAAEVVGGPAPRLHPRLRRGAGRRPTPRTPTGGPTSSCRTSRVQRRRRSSSSTRPAIYFGEELGGYAIVDTKRPRRSTTRRDGETVPTYEGDGGVRHRTRSCARPRSPCASATSTR